MTDRITIEQAAEKYGIPAATIRAFVARNALLDPIGDEREVYDDDKLARLVGRVKAGREPARS